MSSFLTNELAVSILEDVVKNYEMVIENWKDASMGTKTFLYSEKAKVETSLNELREEMLKKQQLVFYSHYELMNRKKQGRSKRTSR